MCLECQRASLWPTCYPTATHYRVSCFSIHPSIRRPKKRIKELLKQHASQLVPGLELPVKKAEGGHSDLVYATRCAAKTKPYWEFQLPPPDYDMGLGEPGEPGELKTAGVDGPAGCCESVVTVNRTVYPADCHTDINHQRDAICSPCIGPPCISHRKCITAAPVRPPEGCGS